MQYNLTINIFYTFISITYNFFRSLYQWIFGRNRLMREEGVLLRGLGTGTGFFAFHSAHLLEILIFCYIVTHPWCLCIFF